MMSDAAAAAWIARIPESQRLAAAAATDWRLVGWAAAWIVGFGVCALVARSGMLAGIRRRLEAERPRPWLAGAACAGALGLILAGAMSLVGGAVALRGEGAAGLLAALLRAGSDGLSLAVAAAVIAPVVGWLMRRRPRAWPVVLGVIVAASILAVGWLPYAMGSDAGLRPAPPSPAEAGVARLIVDTRLPAAGVRLSPDPGFDADVTGAFGRATVILGPAIAAGPPAEARAYVGHLMGHYVHNDILAVSLILAAVLFAGMLAARRWAAPLARALGARDAKDVADPLALPGLATFGLATVLFAGLAAAAYLRWANVRADAYSLDQAREPDGLAAVIEREWDHQAVRPNAMEEAIFYTHPPISRRLRQAMEWKAAHGG